MKKLLALSTVAAMAVTGAMADQAADIAKLQKDVKRLKSSLSEVKSKTGGDNIKWDIDFRTAVDMIDYETASGAEVGNDALFSNRLWLGMGYAPSENLVFKGQLSMHKAWGAAAPDTTTGFPQRGYGYDAFDWVQNENLTDGTVRVRQAYWLYKSSTFFGSDISWAASLGRRPATNGFIANLREDDKAQSPLSHSINMEYDGGSFKLGLDKVTGIDGMYLKICAGRGLTNAGGRFQMSGLDYTRTDDDVDNVDMIGVIFVPYDDGQYSVQSMFYRSYNVPGMYPAYMDMTGTNPTQYGFATTGDIDGAALSFMANGIGDGISDFLDDTVLFASFAYSKTKPDADTGLTMNIDTDGDGVPDMAAPYAGMLGSTDDESGTSYWLGAQIPAMFTDDGRLGFEFNHGSKYWRPFTYGEDTMAGSKVATRGDAYEIYYTQPITDGFSMQLRATQMEYDYTGSQGFFGMGGMPIATDDLATLAAYGMDPVKEARDIRLYFRYRY